MPCREVKQLHQACDHTIEEYRFCGGDHSNKHRDRKDCHDNPRPGIPTTETAGAKPGSCYMCLAKAVGYGCCECSTNNADETACECGHTVCPDCETGESG
jgi:hypothetical protein